MGFFERFLPDQEEESIYTIDFSRFLAEGKRAVLFDIDNTLTPHGAQADERLGAFFKHLHRMGLKTCLISNNRAKRVEPLALKVKTLFVAKANKPSVKGYQKALGMLEVKGEESLFVGDQLFTDIWGAKRAGIHAVLVKPIHPKEEIQIVLKRIPERILLFFYHRSKK